MKVKVWVLLVAFIIIMIIGGGIIFLWNYNKDLESSTEVQNYIGDSNTVENELDFTIELIKNLTKIESEYYFQHLINVVEKYYETIGNGNSEEILNLIDSKYKQSVKIENKNIKDSYIDIVDVYMNEQTYDLSSYIVNVKILNKKTKASKNEKIVVRLDLKNYTFSIIPSEYIENINNYTEGNEFEVSREEIKENSNNKLEAFNAASYHILAEYYYNKIKNLSLYDIEKAYSMLDTERNEEICENINKYSKLVSKQFDEKCKVTDYRRRVNSNADITIQCKDSKNNEYVIIVDFQDKGLTDFTFYKR